MRWCRSAADGVRAFPIDQIDRIDNLRTALAAATARRGARVIACRRRLLVAAVVLPLIAASSARASGGDYAIEGGTTAERAQIVDALNASSFDWSVVLAQIDIHVGRGSGSYAIAGQIWLDATSFDAGRFSWGLSSTNTRTRSTSCG